MSGPGITSQVFTDHLRGTPFLESIRDEWLDFFQVELPKTEQPLKLEVTDMWETFLGELRSHICETAPDIIPHFDSKLGTLQNIGTELCEKISASIKSISSSASTFHPAVIESFRTSLIPLFGEALQITGIRSAPRPPPSFPPKSLQFRTQPSTPLTPFKPPGKGHFLRRQSYFRRFFSTRTSNSNPFPPPPLFLHTISNQLNF